MCGWVAAVMRACVVEDGVGEAVVGARGGGRGEWVVVGGGVSWGACVWWWWWVYEVGEVWLSRAVGM